VAGGDEAWRAAVDIDTDKIDEVAQALLYPTLHGVAPHGRATTGMRWTGLVRA